MLSPPAFSDGDDEGDSPMAVASVASPPASSSSFSRALDAANADASMLHAANISAVAVDSPASVEARTSAAGAGSIVPGAFTLTLAVRAMLVVICFLYAHSAWAHYYAGASWSIRGICAVFVSVLFGMR